MPLTLQLPTPEGALQTYTLTGSQPARPVGTLALNRIAYSAAHVVADPLAAIDPWLQCAVDWDATIAYRQRLWKLGLGVAEAMDTAQRGMGLDWATSFKLIDRSVAAARDIPGALVFSGAGTDHLDPADARSVHVTVSPAGTDAFALGAAEILSLLTPMTEALTPPETRRLTTLLERMLDHRGLGTAPPAPRP